MKRKDFLKSIIAIPAAVTAVSTIVGSDNVLATKGLPESVLSNKQAERVCKYNAELPTNEELEDDECEVIYNEKTNEWDIHWKKLYGNEIILS